MLHFVANLINNNVQHYVVFICMKFSTFLVTVLYGFVPHLEFETKCRMPS